MARWLITRLPISGWLVLVDKGLMFPRAIPSAIFLHVILLVQVVVIPCFIDFIELLGANVITDAIDDNWEHFGFS